jgi:hypothetical protein
MKGSLMRYLVTSFSLLLVCAACFSALKVGSGTDAVEHAAKVQGRLVSLWGAPVTQGRVSFYRLAGEPEAPSSASFIAEVRTDGSGSFEAESLPWGHYRVHITGGDYCCADISPFYLAQGAFRILDVGLPLGLTHGLSTIRVRGRITDARNKPIVDASVTLVSAYNPQEWDQTRSNASGYYDFTLIQPGQYVLHAAKAGFLVSAVPLDLGAGSVQDKDIELSAGRARGLDSM